LIKGSKDSDSSLVSNENLSEILWPSGWACCNQKSLSCMCTKLRTVAASNNRVHMPWSLYYCLFTPHICGVVLRAHSIRSGPHIQRSTSGEVATGPSPGSMSQNGPKTTSLMTSLTKKSQTQPKNFFRVQTRRLADPFKPLNISLAQSAEELWHWW